MKPALSGMRRLMMGAPLALLLLLVSAGSARSQPEDQPIQITKVLTEDFPNVTLQVAAWEASSAVVVLVPNENLRVLEDGVPHDVLAVDPVDVGVRLAFVIDPGDGTSTGLGLRQVYELAVEHLDAFLIGRPWMVAGIDEVTVLVQEGESTELISPMSSDPQIIAQQLSTYTPPTDAAIGRPSEAGAFTRTALRRGLDELQFAPGGEDKPSALVLFSPGMRADTADLAQRAVDSGIPIYIVSARQEESEFWEVALEPLAEVTGGLFGTTYGEASLEPMFEQLTLRRQQLHVSYRSSSGAAGQRQVMVEIDSGSGVLSAAGQFSIELSPPQIELISPAPGSVINRQTSEPSQEPADAEPTFLTVVAEAEFPDGYIRDLETAQLLVDGTPAGQAQFSGGRAEITWDIRSYQTVGQVPAALQVVTADELGLQGRSDPLTVSINLIEPSGQAPIDTVLVVLSLTVGTLSLVALAFILLNRQRLMPVLQQAGESVSDFVERVTGRRTALVAKAYLVPMEGFDKPPKRSFEIYGTTAIGRSRKHADLLFHINDEESAISRLHCTILDEDDHMAIRDEDSTNGTLVNGEKITPLEPMRLHDGDVIDVGPLERGGLRFKFQLADVMGELPEGGDQHRQTRPRRIADFEAAKRESGDPFEDFLSGS